MLIGKGISVDGHFLFLLENIGGTEGGIGERRTDRRARIGTGTKRRLLAGRRWCLDDLCFDNTQHLSDLTTNGGDDHGNLVKEVTSTTCASQVGVPGVRLGEIASRGVGLGNSDMLEVEVGTAVRTVWR